MYRSPSCCISVQQFTQIFQNIMLINTRRKKTLWTFIASFRVLKIIYLYWLTITTKIPCQFDVWIVLIHGLYIPFTSLVKTSKLSLKYEQITKPETFLGFFIAIKCICLKPFIVFFRDQNNRFPCTLIYRKQGWLRGGGQGFPPVTINVAPSYFHRKIEEK